MKICSNSVLPIPSRIVLPVLRVQLSNTGAGRVSPADTARRNDDRSAPLSIAAIIARYAVGEVKQIVALWVSIILTISPGAAFSRSVAVAPNRHGNIARPPSPNVKASGGDPTQTSSGVNLRTSPA